MKTTIALVVAAGMAAIASADIRITEWMYSADDGEFIEFTNVGNVAIDMTGWSFDDDSRTAGTVSLSDFGIVAPGESVILSENPAATFATAWSLDSSVKIIGGNAANLGRNDEINLYNASSTLVDRLTFGDQNIPGTIRTQNISGNALPADLGTNNAGAWFFSAPGDVFGSYFGAAGSFGNPGSYVPAPGAVALVGLAALGRRRR